MGHCRPSKSASSKRVNNSTVRGGSNKRSISKSSSEQKVISSLKAPQKSVKPKKPSESSIKGSPSSDQICIKADDKIFRQLKSLPVNITVWEGQSLNPLPGLKGRVSKLNAQMKTVRLASLLW
ncbi:hypothetical protein Taro_006370 [Colocasia esculenta]|uniref:Uncharacterized protein n=1 Tax=Colocasia esculenta TaxID=4460 RepID=A0A843TSA3_COLES|nr:hypothetical protein [Colocasia esculenta]